MYKQPSIHVVIWQIISIHRFAWCESYMCERLKCTCVFLGYLRVGWMTTTTTAATTLFNACALPCVWRLCRCFCSICICGWSASRLRMVSGTLSFCGSRFWHFPAKISGKHCYLLTMKHIIGSFRVFFFSNLIFDKIERCCRQQLFASISKCIDVMHTVSPPTCFSLWAHFWDKFLRGERVKINKYIGEFTVKCKSLKYK